MSESPKSPTVAVLGAGNLGLAQAGHLAALGHAVRLYNRSPERLGPLARGSRLQLHGVVQGEATLALASTDLAAVVDGADLVFVDVPGNGHEQLATALRRALKPDTRATLLLHPGQTFGSRHFAQALKSEVFPNLALGELQTALYTTRSEAPGETTILAIKRSVALAAYPARNAALLEPVRAIYPQLFLATSTLETALTNVQAFIHPAVCVLNLTRIERGEPFLLYREGLTPAVGECFERCDAERLTLAKALGVQVPTAAEWFERCYGVRAPTALDAMLQIAAYDHMTAPVDLHTRLLWEDVPTGLVPLVELMRLLGLPCPALSGLLDLCVAALGPKLGEGWTLKSLGITRLELQSAF